MAAPLTETAREEKRVGPLGRNRPKEPKLGDASILRLVYDNMRKRLVCLCGLVVCERLEHACPGLKAACGKFVQSRLEHGP